MNYKDRQLLEKYAKAIFGCSFDDLNDREARMIIAHVQEHEPSFMNHRGVEV